MRILVISDTHGARPLMDALVPFIKEEVDLILHAGDNFKDSVYLREQTGVDVIAVKGNCDYEKVEDEIVFEVEGVTILLTHGHKLGVKMNTKILENVAKNKNANIAIFGHTHVKYEKIQRGIQIINPGSLSLPRDGDRGSYVLLDVKKGSFTFEYRFLG